MRLGLALFTLFMLALVPRLLADDKGSEGLEGTWDKTETKKSGKIGLVFAKKELQITWTPAGAGNAGARTKVEYELKEQDGKKIIVIKAPGQDDFLISYKLDGDKLKLDGGLYERAGLKAELRGEWKRAKIDK
jgi:hypothetical protein